MTTFTLTKFCTDLRLPEGLRWHNGYLFLSDMHSGVIWRVNPMQQERVQVFADPDRRVSGLGWLPDGRMLAVSMLDRKLLWIDGAGGWGVHADLSTLTRFMINDMIVDPAGRAYIGCVGYDFDSGEAPAPAPIFVVHPDGHAEVAIDGIHSANGMALTDDARTLVAAESHGERLSSFRIQDDGKLGDRAVYAPLPGIIPDGIAIDSEGGVWVGTFLDASFIRVLPGGRITDRITAAAPCALDCALGGTDGRTLFMATTKGALPAQTADRNGTVTIAAVEVSA